MLGKFDGKTLERAGVQTGDETLDDELGAKVEPGDLANHLGLQVFLGGSGHEKPPRHQSTRAPASDCSLAAQPGRHGTAVLMALPRFSAPVVTPSKARAARTSA